MYDFILLLYFNIIIFSGQHALAAAQNMQPSIYRFYFIPTSNDDDIHEVGMQ